MIEIKAHFSGWHEVDIETARRFVRHMYNGMLAMPIERRAAYIDEKHIRGCKTQDLLSL